MTDRVWNGCVVPDDRLYDVDMHVWVMLDGDEAVLGMTDVAQSMGGRIVQVTWKRPGRQLTRGRPVAVVESAKWVGPFPTPLSGELVAVNTEGFNRDPNIANRDPYQAGWMARIRPRHLDEERTHLVDGVQAYQRYQRFINDNDIRCYRCAD
ncbi:MAG: glycine cleavage system protein H [Actinobacteria bacterium]|nr:glycine cleavage system protein H [Actinomycetota bacterium]